MKKSLMNLNDRAARRLREAKQDLGMSIREVGEAIGASHGTASDLLSGKTRITLGWLEKLCKAFGLAPPDVIADHQSSQGFEADRLVSAVKELYLRGLGEELSDGTRAALKVLREYEQNFAGFLESAEADTGGVFWIRGNVPWPLFWRGEPSDRNLIMQALAEDSRSSVAKAGWQFEALESEGLEMIVFAALSPKKDWKGGARALYPVLCMSTIPRAVRALQGSGA